MIIMVLAELAGLLMVAVGSLMFLIAAFGVSIWWGLFCLFFPPTNLLFLLVNWKAAKKSFCVILVGFILMLAPLVMVENFLTSMRDPANLHFRHFHAPGMVTTMVPALGVIDPQSAASLPELPEQEKPQ